MLSELGDLRMFFTLTEFRWFMAGSDFQWDTSPSFKPASAHDVMKQNRCQAASSAELMRGETRNWEAH